MSQEREEFLLGDQVLLQKRVYVVTHKFSHLTKGEWLHDYTLRPKASCKAEARGTPLLAGAAIQGKVLATSLTATQLALETDEPGEAVESWHSQPIYYVGGGKGYSGQPEKGDRQYLYFPTPWEDSRYILGGVDAGQEKLLALARQGALEDRAFQEPERPSHQGQDSPSASVSSSPIAPQGRQKERGVEGKESRTFLGEGQPEAGEAVKLAGKGTQGGTFRGKAGEEELTEENLPPNKQWVTPGNRRLTLKDGFLTVANRNQGSLVLRQAGGITIWSKGDMSLRGEVLAGSGHKVELRGKELVWLSCGNSQLLLTPQEIHIEGDKLLLQGPRLSKVPLGEEGGKEAVLKAFRQEQERAPVFIAADGTLVQREGYEEILYGIPMQNYFREEIYQEKEGAYDPYGQDWYIQQEQWLDEVYGDIGLQKVIKGMAGSQVIHEALGALGVVLPVADGVDGVLYAIAGDKTNAAISLVSIFPVADVFTKTGKNGARILN